MAKITLIFVGGDSKVDKVITGVTGGTKSHVAGLLFDGVYESTGLKEEHDPYPGVWLHSPRKYINNPDAELIEVEVPNIEGLKDEARKLLGTPYGYTDCVRGGVFDLLGIEVPDNDWTMNCSETWTRLLRAGGLNVLLGVPAGDVTPARLRNAVLGKEDIVGKVKAQVAKVLLKVAVEKLKKHYPTVTVSTVLSVIINHLVAMLQK